MIHFRKSAFLLILPLAAVLHCGKSNKKDSSKAVAAINDSVLITGLDHPWEILWGPDNFIWMTERDGRISRVNPANGMVQPLLTIAEVAAMGEGGLLGMALHPNFATTPQVFVVYNYNNPNGNYREKVMRYTYTGSSLQNPVTLLDNIAAAGIHNGSRLLFGPDLKLYVSTGDASNQSLPQNTSSTNGKILRINPDGSIPADNPIAGNPYWSSGHRNAQGLVFANNRLYSSEHGPNSDDELNIIEKGRNYGWPAVNGFCDENNEQSFCSANNVKEPVKAWTPTLAVCGLDYYNSNTIPKWKNSLLLVALKNATLYQLKLDSSGTGIVETNEFFANKYGRLRDLCISPDGKVYISTSNGNNDKIVMLR